MNRLCLALGILWLTQTSALAETFNHVDSHHSQNPAPLFSSDARTDRFDLDARDRFSLTENMVRFLLVDRYGLDDTTEPSRRAGSASR